MAQTIPVWWLLISALVIVALVIVVGSMLDQGHRGYVVVSVDVVNILAPILKKHSNIIELVTCTTPPVYQVMMSTGLVITVPMDGAVIKNVEPATTLAVIEESLKPGELLSVNELFAQTGYLPNFCSLLSKNPKLAIEETCKALRGAGFSAHVLHGFMPGAEEKIALVASNAFSGWILVFRRHLLIMPIPDHPRFLTKNEGLISLPRVMRTDSRFRRWLRKRQ